MLQRGPTQKSDASVETDKVTVILLWKVPQNTEVSSPGKCTLKESKMRYIIRKLTETQLYVIIRSGSLLVSFSWPISSFCARQGYGLSWW